MSKIQGRFYAWPGDSPERKIVDAFRELDGRSRFVVSAEIQRLEREMFDRKAAREIRKG